MKEEELLKLLNEVSTGQSSPEEALAKLLEAGTKSYGRDATNQVFVAAVNLHVDTSYGCEYTSR